VASEALGSLTELVVADNGIGDLEVRRALGQSGALRGCRVRA